MKKLTTLLAIVLLLSACTSSMDEVLDANSQAEDTATHSIALTFDGGIADFDGASSRATTTFANGTTMYIKFSNGSGSEVKGTAVYNSSINNWEMTYTGNLNNVTNATCTLDYFTNPASSTSSYVYLDKSSAWFYGTGTYTKTATSLRVNATLNPLCARIRFKGTNGKTINVSGFGCFTQYSISSLTTTSSNSNEQSLTVQSSGYTPYIYYGSCNSTISLTVDGTIYTMDTSDSMNTHGKSGYLTIPTSSSHSGWTASESSNSAKRTFTANGVSFDMILVEHGTFTMGATSEQGSDAWDEEKPTHQVTLTNDYYIGETEVTQALWKAVTGYSPTSSGSSWTSTYGLGNNYPSYCISYDDVQSFITKLNSLTGKTFRMPTEAEWEFAARGGNKSKGYKYSGSNTIGDVAWYDGNSNSKTHEVKTKSPNELGIYDMSGNVYEWCSDWYGGYSSSSQTNPVGPNSGSNRVIRGGSRITDARYCRSSYRYFIDPVNRSLFLGFRLALSQ